MASAGQDCQRTAQSGWLSSSSCFSFPRVAISASELEAFAARVAQDLCASADPPIKGAHSAVATAVAAAIRANFAEEAEIDREVDQQITKLGATARGMDQDKLRSGLRERIAKQRGFVL